MIGSLPRSASFAALAAALLAPAFAQAQKAAGSEIKVGGIFDLTGITSDVGKPFAQGVRDGVQWLNGSRTS